MSQDVMMLIDDIKVFICDFSFQKLTKIESVEEWTVKFDKIEEWKGKTV